MNNKTKLSGFSLAKGKDLTGDDAYEIKSFNDTTIAVLCDGVGSADMGAEAARRVCNFMVTNLKNRPTSWNNEKSITSFIRSINSILYQESMDLYEGVELVTTLALVFIEGNIVYGANVGDSRIYLLRDGVLTQLSTDHLCDEDKLEGVLSSAIGISEDVDLYYFENIVQKDDKILLCSDGLYTILDEESLRKNTPLGARTLVKNASKLMKDDLPDDTTAIVVEIDDIDHKEILKQAKLEIPEKLKAGQVIDGYKLLKPLVQNERTWLSENKGVNYVIKFAPFEAKDDEKALDQFVKEAWNAKRLKAGFLPKATIPKKRTNRYYIMEYLKGEELKKQMAKKLLTVDEGVDLAKFLLKMGQYLLKYDLLHGDIKPENIIRAKRKEKTYFKIVDFGSIVEMFTIDSRAGTPSYLSPERFQNASINEQSEIFSIGVTLYESLTGKFPYGEIEPFQTPHFKKPKRPTEHNTKIPLWLESIILRAISIDVDRRYSNYSEMLYEVENPEKVKQFFDKNTSLIEKNPMLFCKIGFFSMLALNIFLFIKLVG